MNLLELLIGQIPEAIYFSLFIIFTKQIKERRLLFTVLMIFEFVLLFNIAPYTVSSHAIFFAITYLVLKVIYKEKCQITDIFTLCIASIFLILISFINYIIFWFISGNFLLSAICQRIILFRSINRIKKVFTNLL